MSRRKRNKESRKAALPLLSPNAAGVDIGAREIFVAVPPDRDPESVRSYATFTEDLHRLADPAPFGLKSGRMALRDSLLVFLLDMLRSPRFGLAAGGGPGCASEAVS